MPTKRNRPDYDGWAKSVIKKAQKIIYARDRICGICGKPVNMDLEWPHPESKSIDHIVPISKGGSVSDISNLQLAHLRCNRIKSNRTFAPQLKETHVSNRDLPLSCDWTQAGRD